MKLISYEVQTSLGYFNRIGAVQGDKIIDLKPIRVIFNPGTENQEFIELLKKAGIQALEACTLVLLRTNQF